MNSHDPNRQDPNGVASHAAGPARRLFERASARLDVATANNLRLIRREALSGPTPRQRLRSLMPMASTAAVLLSVGLAWWLPREHGPDQAAAVALDAAQAAYIADDDADVYAWLGEAPVATDSNPAGAL